MKETDDESLVDGQDVVAIPTTSTKYETWADMPERQGPGLVGQNVHGVKNRRPDWYYTPQEWSRSIGWGKVPDERNTELRGVKQDRLTDEDVSEESNTKT